MKPYDLTDGEKAQLTRLAKKVRGEVWRIRAQEFLKRALEGTSCSGYYAFYSDADADAPHASFTEFNARLYELQQAARCRYVTAQATQEFILALLVGEAFSEGVGRELLEDVWKGFDERRIQKATVERPYREPELPWQVLTDYTLERGLEIDVQEEPSVRWPSLPTASFAHPDLPLARIPVIRPLAHWHNVEHLQGYRHGLFSSLTTGLYAPGLLGLTYQRATWPAEPVGFSMEGTFDPTALAATRRG